MCPWHIATVFAYLCRLSKVALAYLAAMQAPINFRRVAEVGT